MGSCNWSCSNLSNGYYKLSETVLKNDPAYDPIVGEYTSMHNGDGGFNNVFRRDRSKAHKKFLG